MHNMRSIAVLGVLLGTCAAKEPAPYVRIPVTDRLIAFQKLQLQVLVDNAESDQNTYGPVTARGCLWQGPLLTPEWCGGGPMIPASESLTDRRNEEHLRREVNSPKVLKPPQTKGK